MTGPEHYREAERLVANVQSAIDADGPEAEGGISEWTALAQVHATLALAAAAALNNPSVAAPNWDEWRSVAGVEGGAS